jgi:hypothetical protein
MKKVNALAILALSLIVSPFQSIYAKAVSSEPAVSVGNLEQKMQLKPVVVCENGGTIL